MLPRQLRSAASAEGGRAAAAMLWVCCALLAGCETAPAPVSERKVEEYRKTAPTPSAASKPAPVAEPSGATTAPPAATTAAPKSAASKPNPAPQTNTTATATPPPATTTAKPATPKPVPAPEATSPTPAQETAISKTVAPKTTAGAEEVEGDTRPEFYTVKRGDTVYSIALDAGLDYKELAAWNQLDDANVIRAGQQLRLRAPAGWKPEAGDADGVVVRPATNSLHVESLPLEAPPLVKSSPKGIKVPYSEQALAQLTRDPTKAPAADGKPAAEPKLDARPASPAVSPTTPAATPPVLVQPKVATAPAASTKSWEPASGPQTQDAPRWIWPTSGKLLHPFNQGNNPKGVAIGGSPGQPIVASAAGKVVYSGMGLRGYGKLIIIKHDNTYLSVYAHNRDLLVKEGEYVGKGQKIAEMGNIDSERVGLHFEIRRLGKPVDPIEYLPPDGAS